MKWMFGILGSIVTSSGLFWLFLQIFPHGHFGMGQQMGIVFIMAYVIWIAGFIAAGLYWMGHRGPRPRISQVPLQNVIVFPGPGHTKKGPKVS